MFWTYIVSKGRIEQFNFIYWLSNVKNLVLSDGSEHVRNVIQWHKNSFFSKKLQKAAGRFFVSVWKKMAILMRFVSHFARFQSHLKEQYF